MARALGLRHDVARGRGARRRRGAVCLERLGGVPNDKAKGRASGSLRHLTLSLRPQNLSRRGTVPPQPFSSFRTNICCRPLSMPRALVLFLSIAHVAYAFEIFKWPSSRSPTSTGRREMIGLGIAVGCGVVAGSPQAALAEERTIKLLGTEYSPASMLLQV